MKGETKERSGVTHAGRGGEQKGTGVCTNVAHAAGEGSWGVRISRALMEFQLPVP